MIARLICLALCLAAARADDLTDRLARIGTWDGRTAQAELAGPYEDTLQQAVPFGRRSYYLTPWRAYLDTWPARRYLDCPGVNFNVPNEAAIEPMARILGESGMTHARVEIGWGSMDWDKPDTLPEHVARRLARTLRALRANGVRPLILLNANSGWPVPIHGFRAKLLADAAVGAREIALDQTRDVVVGHTGLRGQAYQIAFPLITAVDVASGRCTLSAPLANAVKAGDLELFTLKYTPFGGPELDQTVAGWMAYVRGLAHFCRDTLATGDARDAGFDLEVWNELTFGSQFLEDRNYYQPARAGARAWEYSRWGRTNRGYTNLLCMTADWVAEPASGLPGVKVITGFSNQWPWDNGTDMWPTQTGFSRHYYTGLARWDRADAEVGTVCAATMSASEAKSGPLNALGQPDGKSDGKDWHTVEPGSFFVPTFRRGYPEYWLSAGQTEFMARDLQPYPGPWATHHRYSQPGTGRPPEVWQTEFNCDRAPFFDGLFATGIERDDPRARALAQWVGAKAMLRAFPFYSHKGLRTMTAFAVHESDYSLAMLPEAFWRELEAAKWQLTPQVRAAVGPQMVLLKRVSDVMRRGKVDGEARPLTVTRVVEHQPRLVFAGDGSPAHPDRYQRDDLAVLPWQLDTDRFVLGVYVVTRDMMHVWDAKRDPLDPARYTMPDQTFDVTLGNLRGRGLRAALYDPWTDRTTPLTPLAGTATSVTLRLPVTDSPRFVYLTEAQPGPLVESPRLTGTRLTFTPRTAGRATITWGSLPQRTAAGGSRVVNAAAGQAITVDMPALGAKQGLRVTLASDGLTAVWPRWDWDVAGVPSFVAPAAGSGLPPGTVTLPKLPSGPAAARWTCARDGDTWDLGAGDPLHVTLRPADVPPAQAATLLPVTAPGDQVSLEAVTWSGRPAWRAVYRLDATAHPGERALAQTWWITPVGDGLLVLEAKGSGAAAAREETALAGLLDQVTFQDK